MIISPFFDTIKPMPLDRCTISTSFPIHAAAATDAANFRKTSGLELREFTPSNKVIKGEDIPCGTLDIGTYGGLSIYVQRSAIGHWKAKTIHLNPGKLLYGHNGRALNETECLTAFSILIELLTPLLTSSNDFIHLVPGISSESLAYWSMLEIPMNLYDPDGDFQFAFRNPSHHAIRKSAWRADDESVKLAPKRGQIKLNFYRKDLDMADSLKDNRVLDVPRTFRIEVTLTGKKLIQAFQDADSIRSLGKQSRLVRFTGSDLIAAYRSIVTDIQGCYSYQRSDSATSASSKLGRFMAIVSHQCKLSVEDQITIYEKRFGCSGSTRTRLKNSAKDELSRLSHFSCQSVFSDDRFANQVSIGIPRLERFMQPRRENTQIHPLVAAAYGLSRSPSFLPASL